MLEVDLGHYSRKRIIEKVRAFEEASRARFLLIACPNPARQDKLMKAISEEYRKKSYDYDDRDRDIWARVDVMTFESIREGKAPGYPADPSLLPREARELRMDLGGIFNSPSTFRPTPPADDPYPYPGMD